MINSPAAPKIDADKRSINCAASHRGSIDLRAAR